jgi:phenylacetate-CoA ligase
MGHGHALYAQMPVWAQHAAVSAYGVYWYWLRFGPGYRQSVKQYTEREWLNTEEWQAWQRRRLRGLLYAAATAVPYYQQAWSKEEKAAAQAGRLEDLPLLEKDPMRAHPEAFLRRDMHPWPRLVFHTSGSTGTPITSINTVREIRHSLAMREVRSARWAGVSFHMPRATFSGRLIEPDPESTGPFYRFNLVERQAYLSAYHLRADTAPLYVNALHKHRIQWLTGYAFSYYLLATFIIEQGLNVPPLKAVITTSEKLLPGMRQAMQVAYGCRVYEEYSTVENVLFASECRHGRLHASPDVAIIEVLRPDGTACQLDEVGEVVATSLLREYQPFIRYRVGDCAMWDGTPCPCGRVMPVLREVVGRIEDVVIGPDGRQMVRFHGVFLDQPHVREGQIVQEALDRIRVKVVPANEFGQADIRAIIHRVQERLGSRVEVIVEPVREIPRTAAGKFQAVVSLLREKGAREGERTGISR